MRAWVAGVGLAALTGCGSTTQVHLEVSQLNPLTLADKEVYRAVDVKLFLL
jgi:hypothetical protein